jgi:hypothetical protein
MTLRYANRIIKPGPEALSTIRAAAKIADLPPRFRPARLTYWRDGGLVAFSAKHKIEKK